MSILEKRKDRKNSVDSNGVKSHVSVLVNFDLNNDVYELYFIKNDILYEYSNISTVDIVYPGIDGIYVTDPEYVCDIPLDVIYDKVKLMNFIKHKIRSKKDLSEFIIRFRTDILPDSIVNLYSEILNIQGYNIQILSFVIDDNGKIEFADYISDCDVILNNFSIEGYENKTLIWFLKEKPFEFEYKWFTNILDDNLNSDVICMYKDVTVSKNNITKHHIVYSNMFGVPNAFKPYGGVFRLCDLNHNFKSLSNILKAYYSDNKLNKYEFDDESNFEKLTDIFDIIEVNNEVFFLTADNIDNIIKNTTHRYLLDKIFEYSEDDVLYFDKNLIYTNKIYEPSKRGEILKDYRKKSIKLELTIYHTCKFLSTSISRFNDSDSYIFEKFYKLIGKEFFENMNIFEVFIPDEDLIEFNLSSNSNLSDDIKNNPIISYFKQNCIDEHNYRKIFEIIDNNLIIHNYNSRVKLSEIKYYKDIKDINRIIIIAEDNKTLFVYEKDKTEEFVDSKKVEEVIELLYKLVKVLNNDI
jgi:hypothetical protein